MNNLNKKESLYLKGEKMDNETALLFKKLIYSIARKYSYNDNELEDLYQVGNIGLQEAFKHYKKDSNAKFTTFAHFYIKGEILKYIRLNKMIKTNYDSEKLVRQIAKVKDYLTQVNSKVPSIEEIATYLEVPIEDVMYALTNETPVKSLDYELDDDKTSLYDYESYIEKGYDEDILTLKEELNKLTDEEKKLIELRYFNDNSQMETSRELGISQVQVSRKENKILSKIRDNMTKQLV